MKLSALLALGVLTSLPAFAQFSFDCRSASGDEVKGALTEYSESVTHQGHTYTECRRVEISGNTLGLECEDSKLDISVQIFLDHKGSKVTKADYSYRKGNTTTTGESDGSGIEMTCK